MPTIIKPMKKYILFILVLITNIAYSQSWKVEISSNVEYKSWKLNNKSEVKTAPLNGATIKLMKGSTLIEQTKSDGNGDFTVHVPAGDVFIIEVSYSGCTTKRFEVITKNVPDFGEEIFKPSFSIGGFILSKPFQGIDYSGLQQPLVKVVYVPKIKNFDDDGSFTQQSLGVVGKIYDAEDALIESFCSTNRKGDEALKVPDCPLAKQLYEKAKTIIAGEQYPVQQLLKVGACLKEKEEAEKKAQEAIAAKAEAERLTKEKEAADKAEKEKAAAAKLEAEKIAKEKENNSKTEQDRLAKEKEAADKLAKQKEKEEKERVAKEKAKKDKEEADKIAKKNSIKTTKTVDTYTTSTHQGNTTITTTVTTTLTTTVTTGAKEIKVEPVKEPVVVKEPEVVTTNTVQATPKDPQENKMNIYGTSKPQENSGAEGSKHHNVRTVIGEDKYKVTVKKADEYLKMKRYKEAKDTYNEALEIKPNDKYATAKLAEIEKKTSGK